MFPSSSLHSCERTLTLVFQAVLHSVVMPSSPFALKSHIWLKNLNSETIEPSGKEGYW